MTEPSSSTFAPAGIRTAVVLLSGGMDSVTLLHYMKKRLGIPDIRALSFVYGQKHVREMEMAEWQAARVGVVEHRRIDLGFYGDLTAGASALTDAGIEMPDLQALSVAQRRQPPTYVPHRNLILLAVAAGYAEAVGAQDAFYGAQAQDEYGYWDCTLDFVAKLNDLLGLNRARPVRVQAPLAAMRKADVLRLGLQLGVDYGHTWTCYRGGRVPCGTCPACVERAAAFSEVGVQDPGLATLAGRLSQDDGEKGIG